MSLSLARAVEICGPPARTPASGDIGLLGVQLSGPVGPLEGQTPRFGTGHQQFVKVKMPSSFLFTFSEYTRMRRNTNATE